MSAYLKCWLYEPQLHVLRKLLTISLCEKTTLFQSRNVMSSAKMLKKHDNVTETDKDDGSLLRMRGINNPQSIDQRFIDDLCRKETEEDLSNVSGRTFNPLDKTNYFKQAWQSRLNALTQKKFSRETIPKNLSAENNAAEQSENSFGALHSYKDFDKPETSRVPDFRDPNERIANEYPDDKDIERDWRKNIPLTRYGRLGRKAFYYTKKITKLGREGKINEAMKVFDDWMMIQDRVMPSKRTFVTLIGIVGRAGYTQKAFQLFRQMKHLGLDPPDQVYTSLFNACANCPMLDYGLKHANSLYEQMQSKGISSSPITTMASMKAFALCGDFSKAFQILDEARVPLDVQCFNALLLACGMDKQSGLRRALKVWTTMREYNIDPAYQTYNLLVRCVRDCGVGDVNTLADDLGLGQGQAEILPGDFFKSAESDFLLLTSGQQKHKNKKQKEMIDLSKVGIEDTQGITADDNAQAEESNRTFIPNTMTMTSHNVDWWEEVTDPLQPDTRTGIDDENVDSVFIDRDPIAKNIQITKVAPLSDINSTHSLEKSVALSDLKSKPGRLALMGGVSMLISHMMYQGIKPDIKTFTQLLSCVTNDAESEAMILKMMEDMDIIADIDFLNDVMMRRNLRQESHSVREILMLVSKLRLTPNMRTYGAIALSCHNLRDAHVLLDDMKAANVEPTVEVMGHLIYISRLNFFFKQRLLEMMEELALNPSPRIIGMIEKSIAIAKHHIVTAEKNTDSAGHYLSPRFQRQFKDFLRFYQAWLLRNELRKEKHPWERLNDGDSRENKTMQGIKNS